MLEPLRGRRHNSACLLQERGSRGVGSGAGRDVGGSSARGDMHGMEERAGVGRVRGLSWDREWPQARGLSWHGRKHHQGSIPRSPGHWKDRGDMCHL